MQKIINHFAELERRQEAGRVAYNADVAALAQEMSEESSRLAIAQREDNKTGIEAHRVKIASLKKKRAELRPPSFVNPRQEVEKYARTHANDEPVSVKVTLPNGQTWLAVHNNHAENVNGILAQIRRIETTPCADDASLERQIDALATPPRVNGGKVTLPMHLVRGPDGRSVSVVNTEGLLVWLHRDAFVEAAKKLRNDDDGPSISPKERDDALAELHGKLDKALRLEAAAAMEAERAGQSVPRRKHVHPAVLLGVKVAPAAVYAWHNERKGA
jgi:hypothetical protein